MSMLVACALLMLPNTYSANPARSTGRRPKRSDTGPSSNCPKPKARMSPDRVNWASPTAPPNSADNDGSPGR